MNPPVTLTGNRYWIYAPWQAKDGWKNEILIRLQVKLQKKGIPTTEIRYFVQQLVQENGALDPLSITGDGGMAYGLGQWNSNSARAMRDRDAVRNPDGSFNRDAELERQLELLSTDMKENFDEFYAEKGISAAVAAHNGPGRVRASRTLNDAGKVDSCRYISRRNSNGVKYKKYSCYFEDEVNRPEFVTQFTVTK